MAEKERVPYAHTWDPVSGITVKRAVSSSSRTQAIFSRELRAAVSSVQAQSVSLFGSHLVTLDTENSKKLAVEWAVE